MSKVDIGYAYKGKLHGNVAQRLAATGFNVNALRTNAVLRKDEWKHFDTAVVEIARERLRAVGELVRRNLVYRIPNGMGATVLEYEDMSDMEDAQLSMDGVTRDKKDRPEFDINYLPLPIISKDFSINARVLESSRTLGRPLDTTMAQLAARQVAEKVEDLLINGASGYSFGGGTIRGLTDFANRNTGSLTADWNDSAATGETMLADVLSMKQALLDDNFYGPYALWLPPNFETAIDGDFKSNSDRSIRERIGAVESIADIRVIDKLDDDATLLFQLSADVIRLVEGLRVTTVEWESEGGMVHHFKVMAIMVPQPRSDQDDKCGIAHYS